MNKRTNSIPYRGYTRPYLEVCVQAWNPDLLLDSETIEKVERRVTKPGQRLRKLTYERRLQILGLTSLLKRRDLGELIRIFKLLHGAEKTESDKFLRVRQARYHLRDHDPIWRSTAIICQFGSTLSAEELLIQSWNQFRESVVNAESVNDAWTEMQALNAV
jgi:hypothetical protein